MNVQILYFEGCPNHPPAVELVKRVANDLGVRVAVEEVEVRSQEDAQRLRFFGSPTIQVDGVDIEPAARDRTDYAYSCRMYGTSGLPSRDVIRNALLSSIDATKVHQSQGADDNSVGDRSAIAAAGGSVVAAIGASACCWLPPLLLAFGVSSAGIGASFAVLRPYMLGGAFLLLGAGFYFVYARQSICCEPGAVCGSRERRLQRINRAMLWFGAVAVLAFVFFPTHLGLAAADGSAVLPADLPQVILTVDGMNCEACAPTVRDALKGVPGVAEASVNYHESKAVVAIDDADIQEEDLAIAVEQAGFRVREIESD